MVAQDWEANRQDDLIDRLAGHDIRYFTSSGIAQNSAPAELDSLLIDLARAPSSRLRSALVALLLRHPEYAPAAEAVARRQLAGDPAGRLLLLSIVVAAALQSKWSFSLNLYLPPEKIRADRLAMELGLPPPSADFGRPCLAAAANLLQDGAFPMNYGADWENAVRRLLSQLVREARANGT